MDIVGKAKELLSGNHAGAAIGLLCQAGVPDSAEVCLLLAQAYLQRGDARGDMFSARFFAERAISHGGAPDAARGVLAATAPSRTPAEGTGPDRPRATLGGWQDTRCEKSSPYDFCALSKTCGRAGEPKDFDWLTRNIPCQAACPARTNIPEYLAAIFNGEYERAYEINLRDNVFPGVLGRVCARPCEAACRHGWDGLGEPVAICFSKRSAADLREQKPVVLEKWFPPSGRTVAVVGGGVAGLTVARELALWGHEVRVYEKHARPGGMMNQGIPEFRLPREVIDREIDQIRALGVEIHCGIDIGGNLSLDKLVDAHDAVVLAGGTLRPNLLDLPGADLAGIRHGLDFLWEVNEKGHAEVGENVAVIGGGFTAMDCARTARRLGAVLVEVEVETEEDLVARSILKMPAEKVRVWYRRSVEEMLVTPGEIEELDHEGIPMEFMVSPQAYLGRNGHVTHLRFVRTCLGEPDHSGRRRPVDIPGSEFDIPVDTVLLATGQFPDCSFIRGDLRGHLVGGDGWLKSGGGARTAHPKVFVAGDFATGASSLIQAIGHAKKTARLVDRSLTGRDRIGDSVTISDVRETGRIREMDAVPVQPMPVVPLTARNLAAEVEKGYDAAGAADETQRCYRCHLKFEIDPDKCIYCDWCIKVKPRPRCILKVSNLEFDEDGRIVGWQEAAHTQDTTLIWINQEDCIRCGACVAACPVDAISIQKVDLATTPRP